MFARALAAVGYVPVSELAAAVRLRTEFASALGQMTLERDEARARLQPKLMEMGQALMEMRQVNDELALRLAEAREEITTLSNHNDLLQDQLNRAFAQHQQLDSDYAALLAESRKKDDIISEQNGMLEEANALLAEMQRQRPQTAMQLVHGGLSHQPTEDDGEENTTEDEVVIPLHTVEMACRLIGVFFEGRTHWVLSLNDHVFRAPVHDKAFLEQVRAHEQTFGAGDVIRAEFSETTYRRRRDGEPYMKRTLDRVIEVMPLPPQTSQPLFPEASVASERS